MKSHLLLLLICLGSLSLSAQKLQVGAAFAPDLDYFQGQRLGYGFDYNFRLGFFVEANPIDRVGLRGGLLPNLYGASYQGGNNPFGPSIEQFSRLDLDITAELRYYFIEVNQVTIIGIAGMLFPANVYERVFYYNQSFEQNGLNFRTPEILLGPGVSWNSGRNFNTFVELLYRRAFNAFQPFSVATIELRLGLSWDILGKD